MLLPKNSTPRWVIIFIDLLLSSCALGFAYLIRFDLEADPELIRTEWAILSKSIGVYFVVKLIVLLGFNIHKGIVRHTSTEDLRRLFFASLTCTGIYLVLGLIRYNFLDESFLFPTTVLIMEFLFGFMLLLFFRVVVKLIYLESIKGKTNGPRVLIYGAGISGLMTKRTIEKDPQQSYAIVGFVDDNKKLNNSIIEGLKIFHTSRLENLIENEGVDTVIIAIQEPNPENRSNLANICMRHNVRVQKVPSTTAWINGEFSTKQLKSIKIDDLLGRSAIKLDEQKISKELTDKVILVTGAAGSIGSGMVRQIVKYFPKKVILLDNAESPLHELVYELFYQDKSLPIEAVIGDVRSKSRMENVFRTFQPEYVLHAAAYKHVPLMEENPSEAIQTNILGTKNVVDLAVQYEVNKFVMISTDKAVNPTNVMGASKRIAEMYAQLKNEDTCLPDRKGKTRFVATRFGNVLGSNGSVIPLFQQQIEKGGPITVTDERITRYFMTIPEACQLVLEASTMGNGGEIFVFNMGESVKIVDLAKKMIKLSGLELGKDISIQFTGLRPGEKLYEELLASDETSIPTHHPKILKAKLKETHTDVLIKIEELIALFDVQNNMEIVAKMKELVPEFKSNNSTFEKLD